MAWIELHQSLIRHPKVIEAAGVLGVPRLLLIGHLAALWCWALDAKPEGGPLTSVALCEGAEWTSRKDLVGALVGAGLVDVVDGAFWLHDWDEYTGKLRDQRELRKQSNRESQRRRRASMRTQSAPAMTGQQRVSADIADSQHSTEPNPTQPNQTEQNQREIDPATVARIAGKLLGIGIGSPPGTWIRDWLERGCTEVDLEHAIAQSGERGARRTAYVDTILAPIAEDRSAGKPPRYESQRTIRTYVDSHDEQRSGDPFIRLVHGSRPEHLAVCDQCRGEAEAESADRSPVVALSCSLTRESPHLDSSQGPGLGSEP